MPQLALCNMNGERTGEVEVSESLFNVPLNNDLIHQAVMTVDSSMKRKCGRAKTRGEVSMTTAKMYRQKGLGRARHGARSAPTFVGGGVTFPPQGDRRVLKMPKRARRLALLSALSEKARRRRVMVLDELNLAEPRTKAVVEMLDEMGISGKILLLADKAEATSPANYKSCRNIPGLVLREVPHFNTRDVLWADNIIITNAAVRMLEQGGGEDA